MDEDSKLKRKMKANPAVPLGIAGFLGCLIYGWYNYKNRKMSTSLYLINLRVAAQGTVISCISLGLIYTLCKKHLPSLFPETEKKN